MLADQQKDRLIMTDAEIVDALLRMMDMHFTKFRHTRDIQFKVNLAIWTVLIVIGKFLCDQCVQLDHWAKWALYLILFAVIVFCHYHFWLKPIQASMDRDSAFVGNCRKEIGLFTKISINYPPLVQAWKCFAVGFSVLILVGIAIMLSI